MTKRLGFVSIAGIWAFYFFIITGRSAIALPGPQLELLLYRVFVTAFAIGATFLLFLFLERFAEKPLRWRIPIAFAAALPIAAAVAAFNLYLFEVADPMNIFSGEEYEEMMQQYEAELARDPAAGIKSFIEALMSRYFIIVAWTMLYMALGYAQIVRRAERRAAVFAQEAQTAQLRALRYQVNPHFLFNTLNVLSSLVMRGRKEEAEQMILNLSTFYRTSLTAEPADDVSLAEEIKLQRLYLDIEAVRFPERLVIDIAVPTSLASACVPAMILQPLVENALKYGVARVKRPVTVSIRAHEEEGKLVLSVADNGDPMPEGDGPHGTGVGLANVRDRLDARYGDESKVSAGAREGGGYEVILEMPVNRETC